MLCGRDAVLSDDDVNTGLATARVAMQGSLCRDGGIPRWRRRLVMSGFTGAALVAKGSFVAASGSADALTNFPFSSRSYFASLRSCGASVKDIKTGDLNTACMLSQYFTQALGCPPAGCLPAGPLPPLPAGCWLFTASGSSGRGSETRTSVGSTLNVAA